MNSGNILFSIKRNVGIITINRPEKANVFDLNLLEELHNRLIEFEENQKVKCIFYKRIYSILVIFI